MGSVSRPLHPALRRYVARCVGYDYRLPADAVHHGLPSTALTLIWAFDEPLDCGWLGAPSADRYWTLVAGLHTAPSLVRTHGVQVGLQLSLTPQGRGRCWAPRQRRWRPPWSAGRTSGCRPPSTPGSPVRSAGRCGSIWSRRGCSDASGPSEPTPTLRPRRPGGASPRQAPAEAAAAEIGVSRRHLRNLVVREFGLTPPR